MYHLPRIRPRIPRCYSGVFDCLFSSLFCCIDFVQVIVNLLCCFAAAIKRRFIWSLRRLFCLSQCNTLSYTAAVRYIFCGDHCFKQRLIYLDFIRNLQHLMRNVFTTRSTNKKMLDGTPLYISARTLSERTYTSFGYMGKTLS